MGVDIHVYTVYGIRVNDYDMDFSEAYNDVYDTCQLEIELDGMCGDYMVFGPKLFKSGNFRYGEDVGDDCIVFDIDSFANIEKEYKLEFIRLFPKFKHYMDQPFKLMTFTHYS